MAPEEYIQLKAYARIDGALLSVMWIVSFACYIIGMTNPMMMMGGMVIAICSPFFAASRLRKFRDSARDGIISFGRGYAYIILMFFYAALLFALAQFVYFQFLDNGYLMSRIMEMMGKAQTQQMIKAYGLGETLNESLKLMAETRPIDYALNYLTLNIIIGMVLGLPISGVMMRQANNKA